MSLISVIVPAFNCAGTVKETVFSVLQQKCESDIEIIIINDGSSDSTKHVIEEIADNSENVMVINRQTSSGRPSIPRNEGLNLCKGDFVCFMDADDVMPDGYLAAALQVMEEKNIFAGSLKYPFSSTLPHISNRSKSVTSLSIPKFIQNAKNVFTTSGLVIPIKLIGRLRFQNVYLEDWRFLMQLYGEGVRGKLLLSPRIFYRVHGQSLTPKNKKIQVRRVFSVHKEMYGLIGGYILFVCYLMIGGLKIALESKYFCDL